MAVSPHIADSHRGPIGVTFDRVLRRLCSVAIATPQRTCFAPRLATREPMGSSTTCGRCSISHAAWTCRTTSPQTAS